MICATCNGLEESIQSAQPKLDTKGGRTGEGGVRGFSRPPPPSILDLCMWMLHADSLLLCSLSYQSPPITFLFHCLCWTLNPYCHNYFMSPMSKAVYQVFPLHFHHLRHSPPQKCEIIMNCVVLLILNLKLMLQFQLLGTKFLNFRYLVNVRIICLNVV